jgi:predicted nucleic acid-binding protein
VDSEVYLLDSSIWITVLRSRPPEAIARRFSDLVRSGHAAINEVVRLEILIGFGTETEMERVRRVLSGMQFLRLAESTWGLAATLNLQLRGVGVTIALPDLLIAASAIEHNSILIHQDSDFDRIAQHSGLRVESFVGVA